LIRSVEGPHLDSMYPSTRLKGAEDMTIAQVANRATGAVGAWQNLPEQLISRATAVGLDPNTAKYNEENQRKIAEYLIGQGQANVTRDMIKNNPKQAMLNLSRVWAAIPSTDAGESYYKGVGDNTAHITPQQMYDVFQKLQSGGIVGAMVESGEKIYTPGSYGPEVPMLNESIPRFQSGGPVNVTGMQNPMQKVFQEANKMSMESMIQNSQPIIVPVPTPTPTSTNSIGQADNTSGSHTPSLPNEPSNHIVTTLLMQTYALMNRIG